METVCCNFCGCSETKVRYGVKSQKYSPEYLNATSIVGPHPPAKFTVVACEQCGLMYLNPRYDSKELAAVYPDEQYTNRVGYFSGSILFGFNKILPKVENRGELVDSAKNKKNLREIMFHKKVGRILDVGCCNGSFIALLERRGWKTFGVDFSKTAIENARNVYGQKNTFCGQLTDAKYRDSYFDVVTMYNTIEHLQNPKEVLKEIARILKPSGLLVVQTVDFDSINAKLLPTSLIYPGQHLYYFRGHDLRENLRELGFSLERSHFNTIGLKRSLFYLSMHWWTRAMVSLHRKNRKGLTELFRKILERIGIIHSEYEMLKRMKMVGANNIPMLRADRTFYFIKAI